MQVSVKISGSGQNVTAAHVDDNLLGEGVHNGHADAVQAARHLVAGTAELAASMQDCEDHLDSRDFFLLVLLNRNAAAVVDDRD